MLDVRQAEKFLQDLSTVRVAADVEALLEQFHDDATFRIVGVGMPAIGKTVIPSALQALVGQFEFIEWQRLEVFVSGNALAVRHRLKVRDRTTGKVAETETSEFLTMRDGRCTSFVQFADTALVVALGIPEKTASSG